MVGFVSQMTVMELRRSQPTITNYLNSYHETALELFITSVTYPTLETQVINDFLH